MPDPAVAPFDPFLPVPPQHDALPAGSPTVAVRASAPAWGGGWPSDQSHRMRKATGGGVSVNIDWRLAELTAGLLAATVAGGYPLDPTQCGGYVNRPIGGTRTASLHSFGVAADLNWRQNQFSTNPRYTIPMWAVELWERYGWSWGGRWRDRKDTMHFERLDTPESAARHLVRWRASQTPPPPPPGDVVPPRFGPYVLQPVVDTQPAPEGGFVQLAVDGSIYAWLGAYHFDGANGRPWFTGRRAARLDYVGDPARPAASARWRVTAHTGEEYHLPLPPPTG